MLKFDEKYLILLHFQLLNLNIHVDYQKFLKYSKFSIFVALLLNLTLVFIPWLINSLFYSVNIEELWNGFILQILLCSVTVYLSTACFVVLIIREYFRILNEVLAKNSSKEILKFQLQISEVISIFNRVFSIPFGYFIFGNGFCLTFALFELFDVLTTSDARNFNQIFFSLGFSVIQFHFAIIVAVFFHFCSITMSEKEKALERLTINDGCVDLKRNFVKLLQLEAMRQKFTCGIFDFDMKVYFEVRESF